jgi:beta-glucosidase/6-phospho-beta-glucosidase/beta-galactosidase
MRPARPKTTIQKGSVAATGSDDPIHVEGKNAPLLFGVANSDHQCEAFYGPWLPDVRDGWANHRGMATDFWDRYQTDIDNAEWLGCKLFRFSVSWSRVQPSLASGTAKAAFQHYNDVVSSISKRTGIRH